MVTSVSFAVFKVTSNIALRLYVSCSISVGPFPYFGPDVIRVGKSCLKYIPIHISAQKKSLQK